MGTLQILSFFLLALSVTAQLKKGRRAKENEFPFAVCIIGENKILGSLITLEKLMTSARSLVNELTRVDKLSVVAGVLSIVDVKNKNYQVRKLIYFKHYFDYHWEKPFGIRHDIALAGVDKPFLRSASVNVAPLISGEADVFKSNWDGLTKNKTACQVVSWGGVEGTEISGFAEFVTTLRSFDTWPLEDDVCSMILANKYTPDLICSVTSNINVLIAGTSGSGGVLVCKGNVYAYFYISYGYGGMRIHIFTLFWRYLDYFNLGKLAMNLSSSSPKHIFSFQLFIFIAYFLSHNS